ncbi:hypothetical protein C437_15451 [Haloarcula vallismortis ATCC 29715]|uniref:CARDB domain-containing protein n=1 Tax=Haloarcula vallismortis ATCC 29715 TaxID=662477 RepID=M0J0E9_HALVA|nr:hypothetical protein [Haloarcula vallismortis]EMA01828.1 hypothetical protein C437_15451 [Haloarcula vallismortis ATCC 29715]
MSDYSKVLLQSPSGAVVNEDTLEPNQSVGAMYMPDPRPGEYKIIVQQGGETQVEHSVTFNGSDVEVVSVRDSWSGETLKTVRVDVRNRGDLPAKLEGSEVEARGMSQEVSQSAWIEPNETETVTVPLRYSEIQIEDPGDVRGSISMDFDKGTRTGAFNESFDAASVSIKSVNTSWDGATLTSATVVVANTGDLQTKSNVELSHQGEQFAGTFNDTVSPGGTTTYEMNGDLFKQTTAGEIQVEILAKSPAGFDEKRIPHTATAANLTLQSVSPQWDGKNLEVVEFTVKNTGEVPGDLTAHATVAGEDHLRESFTADNGTTTFEYSKPADDSTIFYSHMYTAESGGTVPVTLTIESGGSSESQTVENGFSGAQGDIGDVDTTFFGKYGTDKVELSSLSFSVRNTGDLPLKYDAVELSIDGVTQTASVGSAATVESGSGNTEYVYPDDLLVSTGDHELTIRLQNDGETVATGSTTVSAT